MNTVTTSEDPRPGGFPWPLAILGKAIHYLAMLLGYLVYALFAYVGLRELAERVGSPLDWI